MHNILVFLGYVAAVGIPLFLFACAVGTALDWAGRRAVSLSRVAAPGTNRKKVA